MIVALQHDTVEIDWAILNSNNNLEQYTVYFGGS